MFILLKPTDTCNLKCAYCSVGELRAPARTTMTTQEATSIVNRIFDCAEAQHWRDLVICFHGGEPLIAGVQFYKQVLEFIRNRCPLNCRVEISIQSNLTLLNLAYVSLFKEYGVQVSTSIDGPQEIHDRSRRYYNGNGSFGKVMKAVELLSESGIRVGIICTMNRLNIGFEDTIFNFMKEIRHDFKANHVHNIGFAAVNQVGLTPDEIANSMMRFFDLWFYDTAPLIKEGNTFEIAANLLSKCPSSCMFKENCQDSILSIEYDGYVTACDAMKSAYGEDQVAYYGNLFHQSLEDVLISHNRAEFLKRRLNSLEGCAECRYSTICGGGCMLDSVSTYRTFIQRTPLCPGYQKVFSHIENALRETNMAEEMQVRIPADI